MIAINSSKNSNLHTAKREKNDEFYTQLTDIENELRHYQDHFKNKVVYCNCDDPSNSNFASYFLQNFELLQLKRLIVTGFSIVQGNEQQRHSVALDTDISKTFIKPLANADFRSDECLTLLQKADIIVTNPPFSIFREFINLMIDYNKQFLIIGSQNALTYKDVFPLIQSGKLWLGNHAVKSFEIPLSQVDNFNRKNIVFKDDKVCAIFGNICWFTNMDFPKRHHLLPLDKHYTPHHYPFYDDFNIINVNKVADIPMNFTGLMGVPITFLDKHNPKQFNILGIANSSRYIGHKCLTLINGKKVYNRIVIQKTKTE